MLGAENSELSVLGEASLLTRKCTDLRLTPYNRGVFPSKSDDFPQNPGTPPINKLGLINTGSTLLSFWKGAKCALYMWVGRVVPCFPGPSHPRSFHVIAGIRRASHVEFGEAR